MTRFPKTSLARRATVGSALIVLAALSVALPTRADARIRVGINLATPDFAISVNTHDPICDHPLVRPVGRYPIVIDRHDRKMARMLARTYDCPRYVLLDMRRDGYAWTEIRAFLSLPTHRVRTVLYPYEQMHERHGKPHGGKHHRGGWR
ncbi:MAG TPA: hypothetical protein PLL30_15010 [Candidatus Krumholzibacteria bacterium]|nr:hypothetical protein [Candidatus Krumholzibacteria bacterium]HPD73079.1 hypothetical protein [Candidatus Krumholzibacteria bacterium]HRY41879.1 hypothetical protein [Candidatus Krumholzibacteria bacterium]